MDARTSREQCGRSCKYWTYDMDGVYCVHPVSFEVAPTFGASTNRMSIEGHCRSGYDDPTKNDLALWEPTSRPAVAA